MVALHLQGRMKLFGTHVYPKNKYLTLQMTRSAKGVVCEDVFESLVSVVCVTSALSYVQLLISRSSSIAGCSCAKLASFYCLD